VVGKGGSGVEEIGMMPFTRHHVEILIGQDMGRRVQEAHPTLAQVGKFIDWKACRLDRLQSEMRTEYKKSAFEQIK
jgi:hypothetical protein